MILNFSHFGQNSSSASNSPENMNHATHITDTNQNLHKSNHENTNTSSEHEKYETTSQTSTSSSVHSSSLQNSSFEIDMYDLYLYLSNNLSNERITLFLYTILQNNNNFKAFILSRMDLDTITIPLLKILYQKENKSSHHVYMSLRGGFVKPRDKA